MVGPGKHLLNSGPDPHEKGKERKEHLIVKYKDTVWSSVQKKAEAVEVSFGARMGPWNHVLDGGPAL